MPNFLKKIRKKRIGIILGLILLIGIFLRVYNFSDWLVFNPDQARDALLISESLAKTELPLLGPEAGNTRFGLGPIFYWLEYFSAKIFGESPQSLAYPDVFLSILTIPLFFFFSKKYFSPKLSLALTAILSVSFFAVRYSRFAMNTNAIPFWTILFLWGIWGMLDEKNKNKWLYPVLAGAALGVGIQLHALLLIVMPVAGLIVLFILIKRKIFLWRNLVIIFSLCLILNIGQIIFDLKNDGANFRLFLGSLTQKSENNNLLRNLGMNLAYETQAQAHMLSALGDKNDPRFIKIVNRIIKDKEPYATWQTKLWPILGIFFSFIFTLGGCFWLFHFWRQEKETNKKDFLGVLILYSGLMFLVMIPIINEASLRYFIVLLFLPFIFLGLWWQFFQQKFGKSGLVLSVVIFLFLLGTNFYALKERAEDYLAQRTNDVENATLGETRLLTDYILENSAGEKNIYLIGRDFYVIRFYKPLLYLLQKEGANLQRVFSDKEISFGQPLFYIKDGSEKISQTYSDRAVEKFQKFNGIMILKLKN
jgi:4-amino-4-deoxy-L-arabinose transferase-like glycosyltransferase